MRGESAIGCGLGREEATLDGSVMRVGELLMPMASVIGRDSARLGTFSLSCVLGVLPEIGAAETALPGHSKCGRRGNA